LNDAAPPASLSGEAPVFKFAAVLLLLSWPANAEDRLYYTFSQWTRLQDEDRIAYISGLLDTLAMAATEPTQRPAQHYRQCITRSRLTSKQLANYLREYGRARPEMQANSVQDAMNNYLNALCGQPPG
jgi:hypothetical protein